MSFAGVTGEFSDHERLRFPLAPLKPSTATMYVVPDVALKPT